MQPLQLKVLLFRLQIQIHLYHLVGRNKLIVAYFLKIDWIQFFLALFTPDFFFNIFYKVGPKISNQNRVGKSKQKTK